MSSFFRYILFVKYCFPFFIYSIREFEGVHMYAFCIPCNNKKSLSVLRDAKELSVENVNAIFIAEFFQGCQNNFKGLTLLVIL